MATQRRRELQCWQQENPHYTISQSLQSSTGTQGIFMRAHATQLHSCVVSVAAGPVVQEAVALVGHAQPGNPDGPV